MVGSEIIDTLALAALVFCAGGAVSFMVALVCDLVLRACIVGGTLSGVNAMCLLCLTTFRCWTGNCVVMGCILGTGTCALGAGVCITGALLVMGLSVRICVAVSRVSTLGTGYTLGAVVCSGVVSFSSWCVSPGLPTSRCMSRMFGVNIFDAFDGVGTIG